LLLLGAGVLGFFVLKASQPAKRPRRQRAYDLDD
jgi:hypothetical protein